MNCENQDMDFNEDTDMFEYLMRMIKQSKNYDAYLRAVQKKAEVMSELHRKQEEVEKLFVNAEE